MTRETLIVLIEKEINELQTLTKGFSEMPEFPKSLLDLAVAKTDNLRDCLLKLPQSTQPTREEKAAQKKAEPISKVAKKDEQPEPAEVIEEPVVVTETVVEESQPKEEVAIKAEEEVKAVVVEQTATHIVAETIQKGATVSDSLLKSDDSVGSTIAKQPIADIKQAISIADRFRFQRELFGGNGEKMNQVLSDLNQLDTLEKAQDYLSKQFNWVTDDENVIDFMTLLQRRYNN